MIHSCRFPIRNLGKVAAVAIVTLILFGKGYVAAGEGVNTGYFGNVAILGYDPVAYFKAGHAEKGDPQISTKWLGATWHFANEDNREDFVAEPIRFTPQYGGFCTLGAAFNEASANIDPEAFRIVDGKLYLFSGNEGLEEDFDTAAADVIAKADSNWPKIEADEFKARAKID